MRLGLLLAGVAKAGTTTLHGLMAQLPGLAAPVTTKELHFFDDDTGPDWSAPDYAPLHAAFAGRDPAAIWFESTPITLFWPPCLERVRAYNPRMKLVLLFRDPVERAYSHWAMQWARQWDTLPFSEAIRAEDARWDAAGELGAARRRHSYRRRGLYGAQLARALEMFPREQLLCLRFDDLVARPEAVLHEVCAFAGVTPPAMLPAPLHLNPRQPGSYPAPLGEADIAWLAPRLRPDLERFAALSGLDVSGWLPFRG